MPLQFYCVPVFAGRGDQKRKGDGAQFPGAAGAGLFRLVQLSEPPDAGGAEFVLGGSIYYLYVFWLFFIIFVDPDFPGNYVYPYRLKSDDPLFKHYSFVELLYLDRFDEQTPRFVFIPAKRSQGGPAVFRTKW
ncbi:MAG: hypothetical protein WC450_04215 [Candidatus Omnitrophota bacterium]